MKSVFLIPAQSMKNPTQAKAAWVGHVLQHWLQQLRAYLVVRYRQ